MKAKFYVILIDIDLDENTKNSVYFGGFSASKLMTDTEMISTDIPSAVKFTSKGEAESMCQIIKEYMIKTLSITPHLYTEEIEAEYKIQSVVEFC